MNGIASAMAKLANSLRTHGLGKTAIRCLRYPLMRIKSSRSRRKIFESGNTAAVFDKIYELNWWGSEESVSGTGSTLHYTENLRQQLPVLFRQFHIRSVFDAPCGDFNWMGRVLDAHPDVEYSGADIVSRLIEGNRARYETENIRFSVINIISDKFPNADLWICRDCLIHLSFHDIFLSLRNFVDSRIPWMLTTTHINNSGFVNVDIRTGDARAIDLFSAPFFLPRACHFRIDDWVPPDLPREMVLFHRDQVAEALPRMEQAILSGRIGTPT